MRKLYDYQERVIDTVKSLESSVVHVVCPTRSGATTLAVEVFLRRLVKIGESKGSNVGLFATGYRYQHLRHLFLTDESLKKATGTINGGSIRPCHLLYDPEGDGYLNFYGSVYGMVIIDGASQISTEAMRRIGTRIRSKPSTVVLLDNSDTATEVSIAIETLSEFTEKTLRKHKAEQKAKEEEEAKRMSKVKEPEVRPEWLFGRNPRAIEAQEKDGQASLVASDQLPIEGSEHPIWEKLGFTFGEPTDELFRHATIPPGWKKEATEHDMWTNLVDEFGRVRGEVFYKAAFYDRRADMLPTCCVEIRRTQDGEAIIQKKTKDGVVNVHVVEVDESAPQYARNWEQAEAWLEEHFPDWQNPEAYWDDEV